MRAAAELILMYALVPLWIVAGVADWGCHRASGIERTSGLRESLVHWLLFAQAGVMLGAVALFEWNAAVMAILAGAFLVHELTVYLELRFTVALRHVRPIEQMVHSFMELLPLVVLALVVAGAWDEARALARGEGDFALRLAQPPWPTAYLAAVGAAVTLLNVGLLAEETRRCLRARRQPS